MGVAVAGGVAIPIGAILIGHNSSSWVAVVVFGVGALVSGVIEASLWSSQGMYLLVGIIVGGGLDFAGESIQAGVAILAGGLWVYAVAGLTDRRSRQTDERDSLATAFRAVADLLTSIGGNEQAHSRVKAVQALDAAQDIVGTDPLWDQNDEAVALRRCFIVALQFGELSSYLASKGERVEATVAEALYHIAAAIRERSAMVGVEELNHYAEHFSSTDPTASSASIALSFMIPSISTLGASPPFRSTLTRLPKLDRLRFGLLLATAVIVATLVAHVLDGPRGYWLPMSVAFIFRPDLGPVMRRAVARTVGTLAGVGIAALVALSGNQALLLIVLSFVMAGVMPWASQRSHALTVMVFTPIVFAFVGVLGPDGGLFGPRIIDTALAALIVLLMDYVLWLHAPSLRPVRQLELAIVATINYEQTSTHDDPVTRHSLRRNALRAVGLARNALTLAALEPHLLHSHDPTLTSELSSLEYSIDAHTVALIEGGSNHE